MTIRHGLAGLCTPRRGREGGHLAQTFHDGGQKVKNVIHVFRRTVATQAEEKRPLRQGNVHAMAVSTCEALSALLVQAEPLAAETPCMFKKSSMLSPSMYSTQTLTCPGRRLVG
jgi:hypothetical protein